VTARKHRRSASATGQGRAEVSEPRARSRARSVIGVATWVGGMASAIAAILGVVFILAPGLKPDEPPSSRGASLSDVVVERGVTFAQYLQRLGVDQGGYDERYLARVGVFVRFNVGITGYKGDDLPLRWAMFDSRTRAQVADSETTTLRAEATQDDASWQVWAPLPHRKGPFYIQLQLFEEDSRVALATARTDVFAGRPGT
jgi:hypothetical protein